MRKEGTSALDALHRGLSRCDELCQVILESYETALSRDLPKLDMGDDDDLDPLEDILDSMKEAKIARGEEVDEAELTNWINIASGKTLVETDSAAEKRKRKSKVS